MAQGPLYTVTELAHELGMTPRAVRFYEDKGLIAPRRAGATRVYSARDRARMILILRGKRLGFSLSAIKEYLDLYDVDVTQHAQLRVLLNGVARRREQLLAQRQAIDDALAELADITAQAEAALKIQAEAALKIPAPRAKRAAGGPIPTRDLHVSGESAHQNKG